MQDIKYKIQNTVNMHNTIYEIQTQNVRPKVHKGCQQVWINETSIYI